MKAVIFCGGFGTRLGASAEGLPKPMVPICGRPILWHIMSGYSHYGVREFILCVGYKKESIIDFFNNYLLYSSDMTFKISNGQTSVKLHNPNQADWDVTIIDSGVGTNTAGRLKAVESYIEENVFFLTYGDAVSDVNIKESLSFHYEHGKIATVTAVQPEGRFGALGLNGDDVSSFTEKPPGDDTFINGGFFVLNREVFSYLNKETEGEMLEQGVLPKLVKDGELSAFRHHGFWHPMDTERDLRALEQFGSDGQTPPWVKW